MRYVTSLGFGRALAAIAALILVFALPAAAQYKIYDLDAPVATQDIMADLTDTVHIVWTNAGVIYYGRIVNNAITGKVEIGRGINTIFWRPYVSVRPDGSSVHVAWATTGSRGNKLMHSWKDSAGWYTETVLTVTTNQWLCQPTCAVDSTGIVHVMYIIWDAVADWSTIFYQRRLANGTWEAKQMFTPQVPEYKFPTMFSDSQGRVHASWMIAGKSGADSFDAYYCTAPSGGKLNYADTIKIPKRSDVNVSGYGDLYVDRYGVVHRAIGGYSTALAKMCIDHTKKPIGGAFTTPTRPSIGFLNLHEKNDPVPALVAGEDGRVVVVWGEISPAGSNQVKASFYDPGLRTWSLYTVDPAAGVLDACRVGMTRTSTHIYAVWRGAGGHIHLFSLPISGSSLSVTSPNGGEQWQAGETHNITWGATDLSGTASLALYKGGTKVADIGTPSVNTKTFSWAIPKSTVAGTDYRVRITQGTTVDDSDADFTILEANAPRIEVSPAALRFGASTTGAKTQDQKVLLIDGKGGRLHWSATPSHNWITVSPTSGIGDGYVTIGVNPSALSVGTHSGTVSISDPDAANSPQQIAVTLEVHVSTSGPIGWFDAPANGAKVKGMVSLDGWALDDLGVERLEIRRDPVVNDAPGGIGKDGLVYIGTAAFIEGSRPDIETSYANFPLNRRGGWGLMMMTYGLPNQGNGTFVFHAVAVDREGNAAEIGKKTLIVSDKYNTKPFGAVDAPAWGQTISGTAYADTGWMLTPRPKIIVTTGKTIWVWIDGVKRAHPVYNQYRADIALEFPLLRNKGGAGGTYVFDTTKYVNGLHTIKWVASDSAGAVGNTGTSYFRVLNTPSGAVLASTSAFTMKVEDSGTAVCGRLSDIAGIPQDYKTPVFWKTGFVDEESFKPAFPDDQGVVEAVMEEDGLVEVRLGVSGSVKGYMVVGDELRPLPVGATLNSVGGTFSWMPGPGFLGRYDLVFVSQAADGFPVKRRVAVRIVPAQFAE